MDPDSVREIMQAEKRDKVNRFRRLNPFAVKGQILFVGSSLMEQFPIHELLMADRSPLIIYNRGIGGYTISDLRYGLLSSQ